jgi:hypothetical protein
MTIVGERSRTSLGSVVDGQEAAGRARIPLTCTFRRSWS